MLLYFVFSASMLAAPLGLIRGNSSSSPSICASSSSEISTSDGDAPDNSYFNPAILHNGKFEKTQGYCTDLFFNRAIEWLAENEERSRAQLLRDLKPELRKDGLLPELTGVKTYRADEFKQKVDWMVERGFLNEAPAYEDIVRSK